MEKDVLIGIHDHGGGGFSTKLKNALLNLKQRESTASCYDGLQLKIRHEVTGLRDFPIAFCHSDDDSAWEKLILTSERGQIRIRVSSAGFSSKPEPFKNGGVYVFHLIKSSRDTSIEEWESIIECMMNRKMVEDLIAGEDPYGLAPFFFSKTQNVLIALSILCQGYLAVHTIKKKGRWGLKELLPALRQMGWLDIMVGPGKSVLTGDLEERISDVCGARWWLEAFEVFEGDSIVHDKWEGFEESVEKEWGKGTASLPEEIAGLLSALHGDNVLEPKIVADAYCAIVERLGGTRCNEN